MPYISFVYLVPRWGTQTGGVVPRPKTGGTQTQDLGYPDQGYPDRTSINALISVLGFRTKLSLYIIIL